MACLLGIDIGTSGTKTVLFEETGVPVASHTAEYPLYQPHNGWAEQDPADWWAAVAEGIRAVLAKSGRPAAEVKGIGLSGQMHGLVMLDKDNRVLRRSIIWCDQRTAEQCAHILLPKDYIRLMLTGEYATEVSDASGMQLLDVPNRCWSAEVLDKLEIDPALLGRVYESPEITGVVSARAAAETGLAAGTPVVGGAGDNAAAAVGTGVVTAGSAFTTIGTSGVVYAHTDRVTIDPAGRVHTFCCAVPGAWHVMGVTQGAGLSLKWFRDQFCGAEKEAAAGMATDPYVLMDKQAALSPVGANRLLYLPYLMGERTPHLDPQARGVFFGLSAMHEKRDLLRAVMEGVSYSLMDCLAVFGDMGLTVDRMAACGGGGSSPFWRQMLADIYGCGISPVVSREGPALGVALLAGVGAGVYGSVPEACAAVIEYGPAQMPDGERHRRYGEFYDLYRQLYPALQPLYAQLGALA